MRLMLAVVLCFCLYKDGLISASDWWEPDFSIAPQPSDPSNDPDYLYLKGLAEGAHAIEKNYHRERHEADTHYLRQQGASPRALEHEESLYRQNSLYRDLNHESHMDWLEQSYNGY